MCEIDGIGLLFTIYVSSNNVLCCAPNHQPENLHSKKKALFMGEHLCAAISVSWGTWLASCVSFFFPKSIFVQQRRLHSLWLIIASASPSINSWSNDQIAQYAEKTLLLFANVNKVRGDLCHLQLIFGFLWWSSDKRKYSTAVCIICDVSHFSITGFLLLQPCSQHPDNYLRWWSWWST